VLYENLREKCLYSKLKNQGKEQDWWNYMHYVHANCRHDINQDCSKNGIESIGVDFSSIDTCVEESFIGDDHGKSVNQILDIENKDWNTNGPHIFPAIVINKVAYRGFLTPENIFQAICEGFKNAPKECKSVRHNEEVPTNGISIRTTIIVIAAILVCNLILLMLYRRYHKKEMQSEVKMAAHSAVSQYFAIRNSERELESQDLST